jgi:hypothetical protein
MENKLADTIRKELLELFEEGFTKVRGIFLDRGTSFFETLEGIDCVQASKKYAGIPETIASHVAHTIFYIVVLKEYISGARTGKTDWAESWKTTEVDAKAWGVLKNSLHSEYDKLVEFIKGIPDWEKEDYFGGVVAILAHCAYHLGAIRQLKDF